MYKSWSYRKTRRFKGGPVCAPDEAAILAQMMPAFNIAAPQPRAVGPVIFSTPHSGRIYPREWMARCRLTVNGLRAAEDAFVDELFCDVANLGAPLLRARFPRSFVDVNRAPDELAPDWDGAAEPATARAQAGLGVIPLAIGQDKPIYKASEDIGPHARARLDALYHPYHAALRGLIAAAKAQFGYAVLIDCHSMPGFGPLHKRRPDFILGDGFGQSCGPHIIEPCERDLRGLGYSLVRNHPYAGGYITRHYGQPGVDVHVLQVEINRDLYLNPVTIGKKPGFDKLQSDMTELARRLIARHRPQAQITDIAAE